MAQRTRGKAMINMIELNNFKAAVAFDSDLGMFRGEILGLTGGADFYADTVKGLEKEFKKSLKVYLSVCEEQSIEPLADFSGRLNLRATPEVHREIAIRAKAAGKSLNAWAVDKLMAASS